MSVDKLVDSTQLDADLTSVANAIRTKGGTSASLAFPADFVSAIAAIPSGGGGAVWTRPAGWPNLDNLDISSGNIAYLTYKADEEVGFCDITCKTSSGQYTVEVGTISGSTFTADSTQSYNSNNACRLWFGSSVGTYKVIRVTGLLTAFNINQGGVNQYGSVYRYNTDQGLLEVRAKLQTVTEMGFPRSPYLQRIYINSANVSGFADKVRNIRALVVAELPYCVTANTTNLSNMFNGCPNLKLVDVTGWNTENVTNMNAVFSSCYSLKTITGIGSLNTGKVTNLSQMFTGCRCLEYVDVENWNIEKCETLNNMFSNCDSLRSVDVSKWDTGAVKNFTNMFQNCYSLEEVDISDWDMSSQTEANQVFQECGRIVSVGSVPDTIPTVGSNFFNGARNMLEFHFAKTTPPTLSSTNAFSNMTDAGGKKIYVPYSADHSILNAYKTASNWSTYASYIYEEAAP